MCFVASVQIFLVPFSFGADRARRDRALLDNGEEDADGDSLDWNTIDSRPLGPARRDQQNYELRRTVSSSADLRPKSLQQRERSPQQPKSNGGHQPPLDVVNASEQAQRPHVTSPTQQPEPSDGQQSKSSGLNSVGNNEAASSAQVL
jgi:hypothetical protein